MKRIAMSAVADTVENGLVLVDRTARSLEVWNPLKVEAETHADDSNPGSCPWAVEGIAAFRLFVRHLQKVLVDIVGTSIAVLR